MAAENLVVAPGDSERVVISESGEKLPVPEGYQFLEAGDGPLTRLVKSRGVTWQVVVKRKRRTISLGVWAEATIIDMARQELAKKRATKEYQTRRQQELKRREKIQDQFVEDFKKEVLGYLKFHQRYQKLAELVAAAVTSHATPVGSGTVARTKRISIAQRAERAVIAWMRHAATDYEKLPIPPIKGRRRKVRQELAAQSVQLLDLYRKGEKTLKSCPLKRAVEL